jgi:hypothetical protein
MMKTPPAMMLEARTLGGIPSTPDGEQQSTQANQHGDDEHGTQGQLEILHRGPPQHGRFLPDGEVVSPRPFVVSGAGHRSAPASTGGRNQGDRT